MSQYVKNNYGKNILPFSIVENENMPGSNPIEVLFFYKKENYYLKFNETLDELIKHYNLFSSRLIMIDRDKFALQYCTDGVKRMMLPFINDTCNNINIEDIKHKMLHIKTLPGEPLLAVTAIPVKDGIFCGVSCSHGVADGISLLLFLFSWGCIAEGKKFPLPSTQRLYQGSPVDFDTIDKAFIPSLSELNNRIQNRIQENKEVKLHYKREQFSDDFLDKIKGKENSKIMISNNQIITSFLLKKYHDHIMPDTDRIRLRIPVDLREVHPAIDSLYVGNAYYVCIIEFTKDEINEMSIYQIAHRLKESISKARNKNFIQQIVYLSEYGIEFKPDIDKYYSSYNLHTDIVSTNLTHINDLESLGLGSNIGSVLYMGVTVQTSFVMLKEKSGRIFAEITSRYPFL